MTTVKTKLTKNEQGFYNYNDIVDYKTAKQFLNQEFGKDWHMKIDLDKLDMDYPSHCVLGCISGYKPDGFEQLMRKYFDFVSYAGGAFGYKTTINWKKKIAKRQAKTAKNLLTKS